MKVAIIGGGLAGCALAYTLKKSGARPIIYEREDHIAGGASGNEIGLYNPRLSAERTAQSNYFTAAYSAAIATFKFLTESGNAIDWNPCGALHLMSDNKRATRFPQTLTNWKWEPEHMRLISATEASSIAGVELSHDALHLPESGYVSPHKLCKAYTKNVKIEYNAQITDLVSIKAITGADIIVLACAAGAQELLPELPINTVRGQVTQVAKTHASKKLKCALCYGGYMTPEVNGHHIIGATFQRWLDHDKVIPEDNKENIAKLAGISEELASNLKVTGHRAGVRATTKDHFPIVGAVPDLENFYISTAHGSHGILSTLMAAHLLTDMILDRPRSLPRETISALSPSRFLVSS